MNGIRTYHGERTGDPRRVRVWITDRTDGSLIQRELQHVPMHAPDGFDWGSGIVPGAGDLALAILLDHLGERVSRDDVLNGRSLAWFMHNAFKWDVVVHLGPRWELTAGEVRAWLDRLDNRARAEGWKQFWAQLAPAGPIGRLQS